MQQAEADLARAQDEVHRSEVALASVENRVSMFGKDADEIANLGERVDRRVRISGLCGARRVRVTATPASGRKSHAYECR